MLKNKKCCLFLILLIACIASHAKKYKALPSLVIEQKDGTVKKFEDDIFNLESQCKCIIEIKENLLCIYYSSDKETSWREDKEVVPETFYRIQKILFGRKTSFFRQRPQRKMC